MKKTILVSIICSLTFFAAFPQSKQESIKELFSLMKTESIFDKLVIPLQGLQKDSISKVFTGLFMNSIKTMYLKIMNEDMVGIYDKYYTQQEINDLIRFYKSKTGMKFVNKAPDIQNEIMSIIKTKYLNEFMNNVAVHPRLLHMEDSIFTGVKSKNELYMECYKKVRETDKYIKYATDYCNNQLMKISIDTIDQRDRLARQRMEKTIKLASASIKMDSLQLGHFLELTRHMHRNRISQALNNIAWEVFERVSDTKTLQDALCWSGRSLELSPNNPLWLDTYANLLYKLGQREEAIAREEEALRFANKKSVNGFTETLNKMKAGEKTWKEKMEPIGSDVIYIR